MSDHRDPGTDLRIEGFADIRINTPAALRRAATLPVRRSLKKDHQAAWLLNAVRCIDLTTLAGDDTEDRVARLCAKARQPVREPLHPRAQLAIGEPQIVAIDDFLSGVIAGRRKQQLPDQQVLLWHQPGVRVSVLHVQSPEGGLHHRVG